MKCFLGCFALSLLAVPLSATSFTFNTTVSYTPSGGGLTGTVNTGAGCTSLVLGAQNLSAAYCVDFPAGNDTIIRLAYAPNAVTATAGLPPLGTGTNFGLLQAFCFDASGTEGTSCGNATLNGNLSITVNQTAPFMENTGQFVDQLSGTLSVGSGAGLVDFSATTTFDYLSGSTDLRYFLQQPNSPVMGYIINAVGDSATSVQGGVIDDSIPEPSTGLLASLGILGIGLVGRKLRKSHQ